MAIIDKSYYDYDYQEYEDKSNKVNELLTIEKTIKSEQEVRDELARFGWGRYKSQGSQSQGVQSQGSQSHDAKELQELVIKDINERAIANAKSDGEGPNKKG